ncbi:MAG: hypothetical protein ACEQSM_01300 [Aliarcobacter sp.]
MNSKAYRAISSAKSKKYFALQNKGSGWFSNHHSKKTTGTRGFIDSSSPSSKPPPPTKK